MAWFSCPGCNHQQETAERNIGKKVVCHKCNAISTVTSDRPETTEQSLASHQAQAENLTPTNRLSGALIAAIVLGLSLLAGSVVLQLMILTRMDKTIPVDFDSSSFEFDISDGILPVEIQNHSLLVEVDNSSLPVEIQNSTIPLSVDDALKVEVVNGSLPVKVENILLPVVIKNQSLDVNLIEHDIQTWRALPVVVAP